MESEFSLLLMVIMILQRAHEESCTTSITLEVDRASTKIERVFIILFTSGSGNPLTRLDNAHMKLG